MFAMRIQQREHKHDFGASLHGLAYVFMCIATLLAGMAVIVCVVRLLFG